LIPTDGATSKGLKKTKAAELKLARAVSETICRYEAPALSGRADFGRC
jgi:hypothetical protein